MMTARESSSSSCAPLLASGTPEEILSEALLWDVFRVKTKIEISPYHGKKHIHFIV